MGRQHARLLADGEPVRRVDATLLFADVSGFTALNERLARRGREGAELMVNLLDAVFGPLLDLAADEGGDLLKFGGDAVLLLFDGDDHLQRALRASAAIHQSIGNRTDAHRAIGRVTLGMSMGLESGPVDLRLAGDLHPELIVSGATLDMTLAMETAAERGEVRIGPTATALLDRARPDETAEPYARPPASDIGDELAARGIAPILRTHFADPDAFPEHRRIVAVFARFKATDDTESGTTALHDLTQIVQAACDRHGITFVTADVGPGGGKYVLVAGAPRSLGDNVHRALDLALDLIDEAGDRIAIGMNEGLAFCGEIGSDDRKIYAVIGDTVNLAARVAAKAQPGEVLCEAATFELTTDHMAADPIEPFAAKGKSALVHAMRVHSRQRRIESTADDITGRDDEIRLITSFWETVGDGTSVAFEVEAAAGAGKSRVLQAVGDRIGASLIVVAGRYRRLDEYGAVGDPLRTVLGLAPDATEADLRELLTRVAPEQLAWTPLIASVLGIDAASTPEVVALDPAFRNVRRRRAVAALLRAVLGTPMLIVVDDAHWLDGPSGELITQLVTDPDGGVMVLAGRRPVEGGMRIDGAEQMILAPLGDELARQIVREISPDLDPHQVNRIVHRAGGNPLFARALAAGTAAMADGQLDLVDLPATVDDAVRAELDLHPIGTRRVLGTAAVLGRVGSLDLAAHIAGTTVDDMREHLVAAPSFVAVDEQRFSFVHPLRHEVTYDALPFGDRRIAHDRAADALMEVDDDESLAPLIALHLHRSRRYLEAWDWSRAAAARADAASTTIELLLPALDAARHGRGISREARAEVLEELGDAHELMGRYVEAERSYRAAMRLDPRPEITVRLATKVARLCQFAGDLTRGLRWCGRAERLAVDLPPAIRATPAHERAGLLFRRGEMVAALAGYEQAAALAKRGRDDHQIARASKGIGTVEQLAGGSGIRALTRAVELFESEGDLREAASARINLGAAHYDLGRWDLAAESYARAALEADRVGDLVLAANANNNLAEIHSDRGDLALAEPLLTEALATWRSFRYTIGVGVAQANLGRLARRAGRLEDAELLFKDADATFESIDARDFVAEVQLRRVELHLAADRLLDAEESLVLCHDAIASGEGIGPFVAATARLDAILSYRRGRLDASNISLDISRQVASEQGLRYEGALTAEVAVALSPRPSPAAIRRVETALARLHITDSGQTPLLGDRV